MRAKRTETVLSAFLARHLGKLPRDAAKGRGRRSGYLTWGDSPGSPSCASVSQCKSLWSANGMTTACTRWDTERGGSPVAVEELRTPARSASQLAVLRTATRQTECGMASAHTAREAGSVDQRVQQRVPRAGAGNGLGLSITKRLRAPCACLCSLVTSPTLAWCASPLSAEQEQGSGQDRCHLIGCACQVLRSRRGPWFPAMSWRPGNRAVPGWPSVGATTGRWCQVHSMGRGTCRWDRSTSSRCRRGAGRRLHTAGTAAAGGRCWRAEPPAEERTRSASLPNLIWRYSESAGGPLVCQPLLRLVPEDERGRLVTQSGPKLAEAEA
ncbi:hypothetical protein BC739_004030 [Kutzneria viridogrisea]|uniref:Uncharacterized protein n=1 Tax=Kutzneria viridogrisea TaxID=47990 RepID=A0ABR6BIW1_9PSEU|nr:hypothetical protein [Kutzneria viridogrisea]